MSEFKIPSTWQSRPSPNFNQRKQKVTTIVLHADAATRVDSSLDWIRRPESKVSYHILVGRTGIVYSVVHPDNRAWHAGVSTFKGRKDVNSFSVGVCLSNDNKGEKFPASQVQAAIEVCVLLCKHYGITTDNITTHAIISPGRKTDPVGLDLEAFKKEVANGLH